MLFSIFSIIIYNVKQFNITCKYIVTICVEKIITSIMVFSQDDMWRPVNYQNKKTLLKFENDMSNLGLENVSKYSFGKNVLH